MGSILVARRAGSQLARQFEPLSKIEIRSRAAFGEMLFVARRKFFKMFGNRVHREVAKVTASASPFA